MLKIRIWIISLFFAALALFYSCSKGDRITAPLISFANAGDGFKVKLGDSLRLNPSVVNNLNTTYTWLVNGAVVSSAKIYIFKPSRIGIYTIQLKVSNEIGSDQKSVQVSTFSNNSPYITKVFDYQYAPGQEASLIPADWKGEDFIGEPGTGSKSYTSLGGWGGYVIAGFDHTISNGMGKDFAVIVPPGFFVEPGVVYVMYDANNDGIPNDGAWAEIKGSEYNNTKTIHNYQVTYYKPLNNGNVTWKDNQGNNGELIAQYGDASWWWSGYGNQAEVVFTGERLPDAYQNISTQPGVQNWKELPGLFSSGYAKCYFDLDWNNSLNANLFDISDAVDQTGNPANLPGITFIKVQSGVFQIAGWLNEISPEISGAVDLSLIEYTAN